MRPLSALPFLLFLLRVVPQAPIIRIGPTPFDEVDRAVAAVAAHVRATLTASSVSIPLIGGELALGDHQAVFLAEFDGPRERTICITVS